MSHDVKKNIQNTKQQKINENVLMLLFLFEINSMESIKRRFIFNFLASAQKYILIFSLNRDFGSMYLWYTKMSRHTGSFQFFCIKMS